MHGKMLLFAKFFVVPISAHAFRLRRLGLNAKRFKIIK